MIQLIKASYEMTASTNKGLIVSPVGRTFSKKAELKLNVLGRSSDGSYESLKAWRIRMAEWLQRQLISLSKRPFISALFVLPARHLKS